MAANSEIYVKLNIDSKWHTMLTSQYKLIHVYRKLYAYVKSYRLKLEN